jgi:hypothetical protein
MALTINPASLDWALQHVERFGDTDIFPVPFEFQAIRFRWDNVGVDPKHPKVPFRDFLASQDLLNWKVRPSRRCLSPKATLGFRISTQIDPIDALLFNSLVYEIGKDIELARDPIEKKAVHSYRFKPDGNGGMYDPLFGPESFRQRCRELVGERGTKWVVLADIADFYPRIYSHPLENSLAACTASSSHATVIGRMLNSWNYSASYGIPVGPSASRLLAELVIGDVDASMLSDGLKLCRFVDDYRIFCSTKKDAYQALARLANVLFENHGLTLQQSKTQIVSREEFRRILDRAERRRENKSLSQQFKELMAEIGTVAHGAYEHVEYDNLTPEQRQKFDSLDLRGVLEEQVNGSASVDHAITGFVLRRLGQLNKSDVVDLVLDKIEVLYPVFKDVLAYLCSIKSLSPSDRHRIGKQLLDLIDNSVVGHLEYHRCWILHTFARNRDWNNNQKLGELAGMSQDRFTMRELICAMGRAGITHWFKTAKRNFEELGPWERRAFLAAVSCLPGDEAKYWYKSVIPRLDDLEKVVVEWASRHPWR